MQNQMMKILSVLVLGMICSDALAQNNQRLYASVNEFTGSITAPTYVAEVDIASQSKTKIFDVPQPGTDSPPSTDQARDLVVDLNSDISLYNGTFDPYLLRYNAAGGTYTQTTYDGWSTVNNGTFGGIVKQGGFVYLTDMNTGGDPEQGILKVNLATGTFGRFATGIQPKDINLGFDGKMYALNGSSSPTDKVFVYDPVSEALLDVVDVAFADHRAVAALGDGTFFTATWSGDILHYDSSGGLLNSMNVPSANFSDIDINVNGEIALGTGFDGEVVLTDTALASFDRFRITDSTLGGDLFVAWAAVPEPTSTPFLFTVFALALRRQRRITG